jgi:hypothetical protein
MMFNGSTTLFFDFDILADGMICASSPGRDDECLTVPQLDRFGIVIDRTTIFRVGRLIDCVCHHALGEERVERLRVRYRASDPSRSSQRAKKR